MSSRLTRVCLFAIGLLVAGCPTTATLTTARPVAVGDHEITVSPGVLGVSAAVADPDSEDGGLGYLAVVDLAYRTGVSERVDIGFRLSSWVNFVFDVKIALLDGERSGLALDPEIGGFFFGGGDDSIAFLHFAVPLLVDVRFNEVVTLTLGPRYQGLYYFGDLGDASGSDLRHFAGTTLGIRFQIGKTFSLMPHGSISYMVNAPEGVEAMLFGGGLALNFGF